MWVPFVILDATGKAQFQHAREEHEGARMKYQRLRTRRKVFLGCAVVVILILATVGVLSLWLIHDLGEFGGWRD